MCLVIKPERVELPICKNGPYLLCKSFSIFGNNLRSLNFADYGYEFVEKTVCGIRSKQDLTDQPVYICKNIAFDHPINMELPLRLGYHAHTRPPLFKRYFLIREIPYSPTKIYLPILVSPSQVQLHNANDIVVKTFVIPEPIFLEGHLTEENLKEYEAWHATWKASVKIN